MSDNIVLNDIKYDLLKIIEPWDGRMERNTPSPVRDLFMSYLFDLKNKGLIFSFDLDHSPRDQSMTFDVQVQIKKYRAPKKVKIHVGLFRQPWCNGKR